MAPILLIGGLMRNLVVIWSGFVIAESLSIPFGMLLYCKIEKNIIVTMKDKQMSSGAGYEDFRQRELDIVTV